MRIEGLRELQGQKRREPEHGEARDFKPLGQKDIKWDTIPTPQVISLKNKESPQISSRLRDRRRRAPTSMMSCRGPPSTSFTTIAQHLSKK
ncbi:hypothetical protein HNY73_002030 [Argiope bruennichi]|uniref:Uncharacterized protein n=1 Tax=Argiope bruennichi TaxID=94029 RepID=A0A8T0FUQ6_ARGBR|nr:hypothetical protein HNY73_002030 [Argiope bruennichi]